MLNALPERNDEKRGILMQEVKMMKKANVAYVLVCVLLSGLILLSGCGNTQNHPQEIAAEICAENTYVGDDTISDVDTIYPPIYESRTGTTGTLELG